LEQTATPGGDEVTGDALFPVDDPTLRPARVVMHVGTPIQAAALLTHAGHDRRLVMDAIGLAIAALVPLEYRGVYAGTDSFGDAENILHDSQRTGPNIGLQPRR
jgi:hypothetical protein